MGDWCQMDAAAPFNQAYAVASVVDADNFTVTVADAGVASVAKSTSNLWTARVSTNSGLSALTAPAEGNYSFPPTAYRLYISSYTSGTATLNGIQVS